MEKECFVPASFEVILWAAEDIIRTSNKNFGDGGDELIPITPNLPGSNE